MLNRRAIVAGLPATPAIIGSARAQARTMQMGIWGGLQGEYVRKSVVPAFEAQNNCKVLLEEGVTLSQIAKMLPYPLAKVTEMGLFNPDAANINANRSAWIEKLNQIFVA